MATQDISNILVPSFMKAIFSKCFGIRFIARKKKIIEVN